MRGQDIDGASALHLPVSSLGRGADNFSELSPFITSNYAYHLNSDLRHLIFLSLCSTCFLIFSCHSLYFNWNRTSTVYIVSTLSFMEYSVSDLFVNGGKLKSIASKNTISDQMHGCSLGFYGEDRPWWCDMQSLSSDSMRLQREKTHCYSSFVS